MLSIIEQKNIILELYLVQNFCYYNMLVILHVFLFDYMCFSIWCLFAGLKKTEPAIFQSKIGVLVIVVAVVVLVSVSLIIMIANLAR